MTATRLIRIWMPSGFVSAKAAPTPTPGLVINEDPAWPGTWNITHVASGCTVASHFEDSEFALHLAIQLAPLCDWTVPAAELLKLMPGLQQKWRRVLEETGALDMRPTGITPPVSQITAMEPLS